MAGNSYFQSFSSSSSESKTSFRVSHLNMCLIPRGEGERAGYLHRDGTKHRYNLDTWVIKVILSLGVTTFKALEWPNFNLKLPNFKVK